MKKIYLLFAFTIFAAKIQAQTVTITDPNFLAWLQFTYPTCMSGNQMNTSCSEITSATTIEIPHLNIANIEGIEYFTSLQVLDCSDNNLTTIPALPASLKKLSCSENQISSIQMLPFSLVELNCDHNWLTNIPPLPNTLDILKCYDNQLSTLPTFPILLKVLHCGGNLFTTLPPLPQTLEDLDCKGLGLQDLPTLPGTLKILTCPYNELTDLPALPNPLEKLDASHNLIATLPNLPSSLKEINVGNNYLSTLPSLPANIEYVNCERNDISVLSSFPNGLKYFYCRYNLLKEIPQIPNSVRIFDCSYNPVECLDFVAGWNYTEPAYFFFESTAVNCRPTYSLNLEPVSLANYMALPMCLGNIPKACGLLSVDEQNFFSLNIFPNPTSDYLQIEAQFPLGNIRLHDMSGRKVIETNIANPKTTIDISSLRNGMYTLNIGSFNVKVIKQ
jgi:hypothetical protein